jgi:hypothetical protein
MPTIEIAIDIETLRDVAGTMIPASAEFGVPGADDPLILDDILKSIGRDLPRGCEALAEISARSGGSLGGAFGRLDRDKREALINGFHASGAPSIMTLGRVIASAYYRDDRVLLALSQEARAPFPKGHEVEQGDWSLLDAVRSRPPFWRDDRKLT